MSPDRLARAVRIALVIAAACIVASAWQHRAQDNACPVPVYGTDC